MRLRNHIMTGSYCLLLAVGFYNPAAARPIAYKDGWMVMEMQDVHSTAFEASYAPEVDYAIGYRAEYMPDKEAQLHAVVLNNLLKRWNFKKSQANLYLMSGAGVAYSDLDAFDAEVEPAAYTGVEIDWENRRLFTLYSNRAIYAGDIEQSFMQTARVGVAPYIGDYGDLHTWLMLQVDHRPGMEHSLTVTPLVRLFKGETLAEAGISNQGDVLFNLTFLF